MSDFKAQVTVEGFKKRMKIFHGSEDGNIERILIASEADILDLVGDAASSDVLAAELIYERARYAYNDSLEFFHDNFNQQIANLSLKHSGWGDEDEV